MSIRDGKELLAAALEFEEEQKSKRGEAGANSDSIKEEDVSDEVDAVSDKQQPARKMQSEKKSMRITREDLD